MQEMRNFATGIYTATAPAHGRQTNSTMRKTQYIPRLLAAALCCTALGTVSLHAEQGSEGRLSGTVLGTEQCYDYEQGTASTTVNTPKNAFDGDLTTYVATYERSHTWVGLDLGTPHVITRVGWAGREGTLGQGRVRLGLFEASNRPDFMDAVPLYLIPEAGRDGQIQYAEVRVSRGFRYVRYCGPEDSRCNVAEVLFFGYPGEGDDSRFYQISNLPTLSYHTYSGREPYDKEHELESEMCIIYDQGTRIQEYPVLARERGNGSRDGRFLKRPYRIKFNDGKSHHMLKDSPLQSPAKAKKWTLIPNWRDKSLMRNNIAFEMSRRLGLAYTPWIQNVDVIVNGEYKGNYQLCDQVSVDPMRVNITEMEPTDNEGAALGGGYLLEITNPGGEPYQFYSKRGIPVDVKSPDSDAITDAQFAYIQNAFLDMEARLWGQSWTDEYKGYRSRLDLESFLRVLLVGEFTGNTDALWSLYVYKERGDDRFYFGPVWDFDLCMDNDQRVYPACGKTGWLFNYGSAVSGLREFFGRVLADPYASRRLADIWAEMRQSKAFTVRSMTAYVDSLGQVLDESQKLNFTRWDNLDQLLTLQQFAPGSYEGELDIIRNYLQNRIEWIDDKLGYVDFEGVDPTDSLFVIRSAADLIAFQHAVNEQGMTSLTGRIEADLDLTAMQGKMQPIGTDEKPYLGRFDGGNHIIRGLSIEREDDNVGLFGTLGPGAEVQGVTLDASCTIQGRSRVGLVGHVIGHGSVTLSGLGNQGSVIALNGRAGGIVGDCSGAETQLFLSYCYAAGSVSGQSDCAALCGTLNNRARILRSYSAADVSGVTGNFSFAQHTGSTLTRCFSTHQTVQSGITKLTASGVSEGSLCYRLNDGSAADTPYLFYQTLGTDPYPVLQQHLEVIKEGSIYKNRTDFELSTPQDVIDFARMVNTGMPSVNAILMSDIDFRDVDIQPIGTAEYPFVGTFDGAGHRISNLTIKTNKEYTGLFGIVSGGATIRNMVLDETCQISGSAFVGLIGGSNGSGTVLMENLGMEGAVTATAQNAGGIFGCNMRAAAKPIFRNCYVTGPVSGERESGQLTGYAGNGEAYNCYASGTVQGVYYKDQSDAMLRGNPRSVNCYSTYPDRNATLISEGQVTSGELCYLLNQGDSEPLDVWYQTLGQDAHPLLDTAHKPVLLANDGTFYNDGNFLETIPSTLSPYQTYTLSGTRTTRHQKGIHIVRTSNGKTYKVLDR